MDTTVLFTNYLPIEIALVEYKTFHGGYRRTYKCHAWRHDITVQEQYESTSGPSSEYKKISIQCECGGYVEFSYSCVGSNDPRIYIDEKPCAHINILFTTIKKLFEVMAIASGKLKYKSTYETMAELINAMLASK